MDFSNESSPAKHQPWTAILLAVTVSATAIAAEPGDTKPPGEPPKSKGYFTEFAFDLSKYDYAENFQPPGKSTENGILPGFLLAYRYQPDPEANWFKITFEFSPGGTHYDGTTQPPKFLPIQQNTNNQFYRLEGYYAWNAHCGNPEDLPFCVSLYGGIGGRLWARGATAINNGVLSLGEVYSWLYLPVGVRIEQELPAGWSIGLDTSLRWMFLGQIVVKFSDLDPSFEDSQAPLGSKVGLRAELPIRYRLNPRLQIVATPWFEFSSIGQSKDFDVKLGDSVIGQGFEPTSRTYQYGALVGMVFGI